MSVGRRVNAANHPERAGVRGSEGRVGGHLCPGPPPPDDSACAVAPSISETAPLLQEASAALREGLLGLVAAVRQADGQHVDVGPGTVAVRGASRKVAGTADAAARALSELERALEDLVVAEGGAAGGSAG